MKAYDSMWRVGLGVVVVFTFACVYVFMYVLIFHLCECLRRKSACMHVFTYCLCSKPVPEAP